MKISNKFLFLFIISFAFILGGCNLIGQSTDKNDQAAVPIAQNGSPQVEVQMDDKAEIMAYMDVSPEEAKKLIDENPDLIIVDVSPKYDEGHLPGAVNYYVGDGSLDEAIPNLDKMATYLVYCHVDSASISGSEKLVEAGFENVYRLEGNYAAWVAAGYSIEK
ncbi:rhodanese-like domain-containing protein [Patescibacteria group bacterium]